MAAKALRAHGLTEMEPNKIFKCDVHSRSAILPSPHRLTAAQHSPAALFFRRSYAPAARDPSSWSLDRLAENDWPYRARPQTHSP